MISSGRGRRQGDKKAFAGDFRSVWMLLQGSANFGATPGYAGTRVKGVNPRHRSLTPPG